MKVHPAILFALALLTTCQPADPAPADCGQPQTDMVAYLAGQHVDPSFALTRDSVVCFSVGQDIGLVFLAGSASRGSVWHTGTSFPLKEVPIPGSGPDQAPSVSVSFVFPSNRQSPSELQPGRYEWFNQQRLRDVDPSDLSLSRPWVQAWLSRGWHSMNPANTLQSSELAQGIDCFFEITRLEPHPADEQQIMVTGQFTVRVHGQADQWTQARPSILLRQVRFRSAFYKPGAAYRRLL